MKFSVNNQEFLKALNTVSRAISAKSTMPILECVYIEASDGSLVLKGSDGELSIISKMNASVTMDGKIVIPIRTLIELVRTYSEDMLDFFVDEKNVMNITCSKANAGTSDVSILGRDPAEYPWIESYDVKDFIKIENNTLKNLIKDTVFACAYQESISPILTGILVEYKDDMLQFVALDGYKLALRREPIKNENGALEEISCIVPGRTLNEILKILSIYDYDTLVHITDNKFIVNIGHTQIVSNLLDGNFIKYESLIPKESNTIVKVNTNELLNSISRASLIIDESKNSLIRMDYTDDNLVITSESEIGKVTEDVSISKNGEDLQIAFNSKFFIEILKIIADERVIIEFKDHLSPTLIKPIEDDKYMYLIMPVVIRNS